MLQVDHLQPELESFDKFKDVHDPKKSPPDMHLSRVMYSCIKSSMRNHSRRPTSTQVCVHVCVSKKIHTST